MSELNINRSVFFKFQLLDFVQLKFATNVVFMFFPLLSLLFQERQSYLLNMAAPMAPLMNIGAKDQIDKKFVLNNLKDP